MLVYNSLISTRKRLSYSAVMPILVLQLVCLELIIKFDLVTRLLRTNELESLFRWISFDNKS